MSNSIDTTLAIAETAVPVARRDRIATIDILRGFALLGILLLNIDSFVGPESEAFHDVPVGLFHPAFTGWHAGLDYLIFTVKWAFFEGKMRALFQMLFGGSTLLLLQRIEQRGGVALAADVFHRRNMWLMLFGLIHTVFIWHGDILLFYGSLALLLLYPLRNVAANKLFIAGMLLWLVGGTIGVNQALQSVPRITADLQLQDARAAQAAGTPLNDTQKALIANDAKAQAEAARGVQEQMESGRNGFIDSIHENAAATVSFHSLIWSSGFVFEGAGAMIAGMGLFKLGFLSGIWPSRRYAMVVTVGYVVGLPLGLFGAWYSASHGFTTSSVLLSMFLPYMVAQAAMALGNAATVVLISRIKDLGWLMSTLGAVGRMAVTNYLLTSIVCRFVFSWGPWKLYGALEYYQYLYVIGLVWLFNLVFSRIWLSYFAFGPAEWLWRSLTYWKFQPMWLDRPLPEQVPA